MNTLPDDNFFLRLVDLAVYHLGFHGYKNAERQQKYLLNESKNTKNNKPRCLN